VPDDLALEGRFDEERDWIMF